MKEEINLKKYLKEGVKLGHFEPEILNVDINDIRKGIMPEFPKDPPPEMIGGYSAKSRLVRKDPELPPFINVTKKDLARNHKLTDKEISQFMDEINMINDYIKKNPAELIYAMTRYPKDDPRLAQLNFKMDEMKRASDQYVETHFPENVSLFNKLQNKIKQNIEMTNPKNFTGHKEAPKFTDLLDVNEQKKKTVSEYFKKPFKKSKNKKQHIKTKEVKKKNIELTNAKKLEEKKIENKKKILKSAYEKQKSDWRVELKESDWTPIDSPIANSTSQTFTYSVPNFETGEPNTFTTSGLGGAESQPSSVKVDFGFGEGPGSVSPPSYNQLALAGYAKPLLMKKRDTEDVNPRLDASQEFAQKVGADVMMNARVSSDMIREMDIAYEQRQKKIQELRDKKDKVYNDKYKPQYDSLNNKMRQIQSKYFNQDTMRTDDAIDGDPEYKALLKQMQKLSDAEDAEMDRLDAEAQIPPPSEYQVPGSKEYKDMQRVSFDEWIKTVGPFAYGSKDNFLIKDPERRWTYMRDWANQGKRPMNLSRITALKTVLNPNTGKSYNEWHPEDPQSKLGEYVSSKLKDIGDIQWDGYRGMGSSVDPVELYIDVLSKGPAVLDIYMQELTVFEENMTGVNDLLEKDLKEVKNNLKRRNKKSSEINRRTYNQAKNLRYYKNYLEQIKNHKARISAIIPDIRKAFEGNFEPTPPPPPPSKPPAEFNYMDDMPPEGGTFDKDGNYIPPGFEDAIRTDQIYDADEVSAALKDPGKFESLLRNVADRVNVGTAKNIYDYHLRFLNNPTSRIQDVSKLVKKKDLEELIKLINSHDKKKLKFSPKVIYGELQKAIDRVPGLANGIGNLDQAKLYVRGNYYYIEKPYDFSNIFDTIGKKGLNAPAYALLQTLRGNMKLKDFLLGTKTMNMRIKIPIKKNKSSKVVQKIKGFAGEKARKKLSLVQTMIGDKKLAGDFNKAEEDANFKAYMKAVGIKHPRTLSPMFKQLLRDNMRLDIKDGTFDPKSKQIKQS